MPSPSTPLVSLAANENPWGMPASARRAIQAVIDSPLAGQYPDGTGRSLKAALASRLGVPPEWIVLGSGSSEILELAAQSLVAPGEGVVYSQYGFIVYGQAAAHARARTTVVPARDHGHDLAAIRAAVDADTRLVFVANPNNPTGHLLPAAELEAFVAGLPPHVTLLLDEAYTDYLPAEDAGDSIAWVRRHPNLIVARTFSKAYGLAGLRIGYALAQPAIARRLEARRPRFNITAPALAAAEAALADREFLDATRTRNLEGRAQLARGLAAAGYTLMPSAANFVTVHVGDAAAAEAALLAHGIAVSRLEPYGLAEWLRVSVGKPEDNARVIDVLASHHDEQRRRP